MRRTCAGQAYLRIRDVLCQLKLHQGQGFEREKGTDECISACIAGITLQKATSA